MKRKNFLIALTTVSILSSSSLFALTSPEMKADTTLRVGDKIITVRDKGNRMDITVKRVSPSGDTINATPYFKGSYGFGKKEEQTYLTDRVRIPFIPERKERNFMTYGTKGKEKKVSRDISALGVGFSKFNFSDAPEHVDLSGSYRFMIEVLSANIRTKSMTFTLGTTFDFNKIKLLDRYTLQRNADGVTVMTPPNDATNFKKNRLSATYLNLYGKISWNPIAEARRFFIYGYAGIKLKTASSMKAWKSEGGKLLFNGDSNLRGALPEIGGGIGYGKLGLQVLHTPQSLFVDGKGPDLKITTIGITYGF